MPFLERHAIFKRKEWQPIITIEAEGKGNEKQQEEDGAVVSRGRGGDVAQEEEEQTEVNEKDIGVIRKEVYIERE